MPFKIINKTGRADDTKIFLTSDDGSEIDITDMGNIYNTVIELKSGNQCEAVIHATDVIIEVLNANGLICVKRDE